MKDDLFAQLRQALPNDIDDDTVREMAEWSDPDDFMDEFDEFLPLHILVEDPENLTQEQIEELIALEESMK